jgi:hypothetical protein
VVSGTIDKISPKLQSSVFTLSGGATHTLTFGTKSSSAGGTYPPAIYVVEVDSSGNTIRQHGEFGFEGTTGWGRKTMTFTTSSLCRKAYVYANIYKGHGTVWIDDVEVR